MKRATQEMGCLYLVPVPIGNLGDITLRALEVLKSVDLIAAEDTRKAGFLLAHHQIAYQELTSFHKFNERAKQQRLVNLLQSGKDVAVVSDAGTPALSDPATLLVNAAIENQIKVIALPGASALLPALTASGLNDGPFLFLGFLSTKSKDRLLQLKQISQSLYPVVIYEAPHRIEALLNELYDYLGERKVTLGREISKMHEEYVRGNLSELRLPGSVTIKGEFVVVIDKSQNKTQIDQGKSMDLVSILKQENIAISSATKILMQATGLKRNQAYQMLLAAEKSDQA